VNVDVDHDILLVQLDLVNRPPLFDDGRGDGER
jgi:hypothetical protein